MTFQELLSRPKVAQALGYAISKHGDQKYGDKPYQVHLLAVAEVIFKTFLLSEDVVDIVIPAALLHDTLEDTDARAGEIADMFGPGVRDIVQACTKQDDPDLPKEFQLCRRCSFKKTVPALRRVPFAKMVKMADRLANMQNALENRSTHLNMYVREYQEFRALLYKEGELEKLWDRLDEVYKRGVERKK